MSLFKNGVGRPSNETIKRRRIFYVACAFLLVAVLYLGYNGIMSIGDGLTTDISVTNSSYSWYMYRPSFGSSTTRVTGGGNRVGIGIQNFVLICSKCNDAEIKKASTADGYSVISYDSNGKETTNPVARVVKAEYSKTTNNLAEINVTVETLQKGSADIVFNGKVSQAYKINVLSDDVNYSLKVYSKASGGEIKPGDDGIVSLLYGQKYYLAIECTKCDSRDVADAISKSSYLVQEGGSIVDLKKSTSMTIGDFTGPKNTDDSDTVAYTMEFTPVKNWDFAVRLVYAGKPSNELNISVKDKSYTAPSYTWHLIRPTIDDGKVSFGRLNDYNPVFAGTETIEFSCMNCSSADLEKAKNASNYKIKSYDLNGKETTNTVAQIVGAKYSGKATDYYTGSPIYSYYITVKFLAEGKAKLWFGNNTSSKPMMFTVYPSTVDFQLQVLDKTGMSVLSQNNNGTISLTKGETYTLRALCTECGGEFGSDASSVSSYHVKENNMIKMLYESSVLDINGKMAFTYRGASVDGKGLTTLVYDLQFTPKQTGNVKVRLVYAPKPSNTLNLSITNKVVPKATVSLSGGNSSFKNGDVTLKATVTNGTAKTYTWYKDGAKYNSCTGATCKLTTTQNSNYKVVVTTTDGQTATSTAQTVKIDKTKPSVKITGTKKIKAVQTAVVSPSSTISGPYTYQWYKVSLFGKQSAIGGATGQTYKPTGLGTYMVKVKTPTGLEASAKVTILRLF